MARGSGAEAASSCKRPDRGSSGSSSPRVRPPSDPQEKLQRTLARRLALGEEVVWRRWRSRMRHLEDDPVDGPRRRRVGFSYGELQLPAPGLARSRHLKNPVTSVNVVSSNGVCNGAARHTSPFYNDKLKFEDKPFKLRPDMRGTFKAYCEHCTIHGLKYVGDTSLPNFERIFWIFSFIMAIFGAGYFIWLLYSKFSLSPIIISRSSEPVSIDQFPFPAITVCNMNRAKRSVAEDILRGNDSLQKFFLDDTCDWNSNTYDEADVKINKQSGEWENIYQFLLNVSQGCSEMLYHCSWHTNTTNCTDIFNPVLTDEGLCCRFNSVPKILHHPRTWENLQISWASEMHIDWNPEYVFGPNDHPNAIPWRAYGSGLSYGLTLVLDVNVDEYYCSSTASVGFKMLLHSPVETPQIADFAFTLAPGRETRVIITPHISDADISIMKIPPKVRRCYFLREKHLRYYRTYTMRNCVLECEANFTLQYCECMQYYMPAANDTRICGKNDDDCTAIARRIMKTKLYDEDDARAALNVTEIPSCKCYPGCNEINYSTEISQSVLLAKFDIPTEYLKHNGSYFENNIAVVHIFFVDSSYQKYKKNELYGFPELLSNTGGLLGLFMGFSLLSVIEIIYYFTIRVCWRVWKTKPENDKNKFTIQSLVKRPDFVYPFAQ